MPISLITAFIYRAQELLAPPISSQQCLFSLLLPLLQHRKWRHIKAWLLMSGPSPCSSLRRGQYWGWIINASTPHLSPCQRPVLFYSVLTALGGAGRSEWSSRGVSLLSELVALKLWLKHLGHMTEQHMLSFCFSCNRKWGKCWKLPSNT